MKLLVFSAVLALAALRAGAQPVPAQAISIEQAVQEAVQNNPGLLAERLGIHEDGDPLPENELADVYDWLGELQWALVEALD